MKYPISLFLITIMALITTPHADAVKVDMDQFTQYLSGSSSQGPADQTAMDGDFNGDGYDDLLIYQRGLFKDGIPDQLDIVYGEENFNLSTATRETISTFECSTCDVRYIGDINGDGFDDLFITRDNGDIILTGTDSVSTVSSITVPTERVTHQLDFNGDGNDDLLGLDISKKRALLWYGPINANPTVGNADLTFSTEKWNSASGDLNGDGNDDIIFFHPYSRELQIYLGADASPTISDSLIKLPKKQVIKDLTIGDANLDGFDDIVVGTYSKKEAIFGKSRVEIYIGAASLSSTMNTKSSNRKLITGDIGSSVAFSDVNGDANDDLLVVHNPYAYASTSTLTGPDYQYGNVHVFNSRTDWPSKLNANDYSILFSGVEAESGWHDVHLNGVNGDLNGDSLDDLILSAPEYNDGSSIGRLYSLLSTDNDGDGVSALEGDCNDQNAAFFPGAADKNTGDGISQNCDRIADEGYTFSESVNGEVVSITPLSFHRIRVTYADGKSQIIHTTKNWVEGKDKIARLKKKKKRFVAIAGRQVENRVLKIFHLYSGNQRHSQKNTYGRMLGEEEDEGVNPVDVKTLHVHGKNYIVFTSASSSDQPEEYYMYVKVYRVKKNGKLKQVEGVGIDFPGWRSDPHKIYVKKNQITVKKQGLTWKFKLKKNGRIKQLNKRAGAEPRFKKSEADCSIRKNLDC